MSDRMDESLVLLAFTIGWDLDKLVRHMMYKPCSSDSVNGCKHLLNGLV